MIAQTAGMVRARNEAGAERVHLRERGNLAHIAEIVSELTARERWAACWLNGDEVRRILAFELVRHEWSHETTQVRSTACAADQDIGLHADLLERRFRLEADDGLVQQHLVEHRTQHIAAAFGRNRFFNRFRNSGTERSGVVRILFQNGTTNVGLIRRRRRNTRIVGLHDRFTERLLQRRALHHEHMQIESEEARCHRKRGAPLACARFSGEAFQSLLFRVVSLRDRRVELVRT
ncbi:uncharacterized protein BN592_01097 [Eggerthella sp. CAG:298]|nr:uncharacterized protein BN592_01097 [Eggerthella sp. CAG:298]